MLGDRWICDRVPTERFPDYTRGNAGEVLAESLVTKDTNEVGFNAVAVELDGIAAHIALTKDC